MLPKLLLAFLALFLAGCSGPDDAAETSPGTVPAGGPATTSSTVSPPESATVTTAAPPTTAETTTTSAATTTTLPPLAGLDYTAVADIAFPIMLAARPGDESALLAQRGGQIRLFDGGGVGETVVDLSDRTTSDGERGLLGVARHPDDDSRLFVHYTDLAGDTVVSELTFDGQTADMGSERVLLAVPQPARNHNGGMIQFGPDGALYVGLGDGGGAGDRFRNGQNPDTLLGGIVRIDVDSGDAELWHMGLRNPWRFWIDDDDIWIADVGQNAYEEVDLADVTVAGINYGWPITEADHCYQTVPCDTAGLTAPLLEVTRGDAGSCAITGGVVYRGATIPELAGRFLFSDYCGGYLRSVGRDGEVIDHTEDVGAPGPVVSFGVDGAGGVYVLTTEQVLRLDPRR